MLFQHFESNWSAVTHFFFCWSCKWAEMNTCFSMALSLLFHQSFSKDRFIFCLVCGCYFRKCFTGGTPLDIPCTQSLWVPSPTHLNQPALTLPSGSVFNVYVRITLGFGLLFSLIQKPEWLAFLHLESTFWI